MVMEAGGIKDTGAGAALAPGELSKSPVQELVSKEQFLNLLITQLRHQDPLKPQESTEFVAQLAQFTSLEQLLNINANMVSMQSAQKAAAKSMALGYMGKVVEVPGDRLYLKDGESLPVSYKLSDDASQVTVSIRNSSGLTVKRIEGAPAGKGYQEVDFNGLDSSGNLLGDGDYSFKVAAQDKRGNSVKAEPFIIGEVTGVMADEDGNPILLLGLSEQEVPIGKVRKVHAF